VVLFAISIFLEETIMKQRTPPVTPAVVVSGLALALSSPGVLASAESAVHTQGNVTYVVGGLAKADANAIEHAAPFYSLQLEFLRKAEPKDEYLSHVKVRIKDAQGKMVLDVTTDGPFLLARLPAGKYTVSAARDGEVKSRIVRVIPHRHQRAVFRWQA